MKVLRAERWMRRNHGERPRRRAEISEGEYRVQTGNGARLLDVDRPDPSMSVWRSQDDRVQHAGQHDVADVAPATFEKARIFFAAKTIADELHAGSGIAGRLTRGRGAGGRRTGC